MNESEVQQKKKEKQEKLYQPKQLSRDIPLWEKQPSESAQAFQAFCLYRDAGTDRSYVKVSEEVGKSNTLICRWGKIWHWVARASAWDAEVDRQARDAAIKAVRKMNEKHANVASGMISIVTAQLNKVIQDLAKLQAGHSAEEYPLTPMEAARWIEVAAKVERIARGEPSEKVVADVKGQVKHEHEHKHSHLIDIAKRAVADPRARQLARDVFRRGANARRTTRNLEGGRTPEL